MSRKFRHKLIQKAIKHYRYEEVLDQKTNLKDFERRYKNFTDKDTLKNYTNTIYKVLSGAPQAIHIAAKNLLFQENPECWKYFERTALFWTYAHIKDEWIDHLKDALEYALFVERDDLLKILLDKSKAYLSLDAYQNNKDHIKQKVYPSTHLVHFLIEKWLGENPVKTTVLKYGDGYGIYQRLIDDWEDYSQIESSYWDQLCEYHLNAIGLQAGEKYEHEEFLGCGLIPMELLNLFKTRKKLGLDVPEITHELFQTPMAKQPQIPTGYNQELDVRFQMIDRTVKTKKKHTYQQIVEILKDEHGENANLFY